MLHSLSPYGSQGGISGKVTGVDIEKYGIATYIDVYGGWWNKPFFDEKIVSINTNGTFSVDTVTGGNDNEAIAYEVFVVPYLYSPPSTYGWSIPGDVTNHSIAIAYADRPQGYPGSAIAALATVKSITMTHKWGLAGIATDTISVSGTLPITNTWPIGANITMGVGYYTWKFAPLSRTGTAVLTRTGTAILVGGDGTQRTNRITVTASKNYWAFTATLYTSVYDWVWHDYGMPDENISSPGIPAFMPVSITLNGSEYDKMASGSFISHTNKTGIFTGSAK